MPKRIPDHVYRLSPASRGAWHTDNGRLGLSWYSTFTRVHLEVILSGEAKTILTLK